MTEASGLEPIELAGGLRGFERRGRADLAPAVLLHGAGANALTWTGILPAFGERRVLLVDMPGHGSSATPATWDLEATATAIARAVTRALHGEAAIWGGHSWGGKVAGLVAALDPPACRGLLLFDPSPSSAVPIDIDEFVDGTWGDEMKGAPTLDAALIAVGRLQRHWQPWTTETAAAFHHGLARARDGYWRLRPTRDDLVGLATAVLHGDASEALALAASRVPALLLVAAESVPWQEVTNMLVYRSSPGHDVRDGEVVVIDGNHWIHQCNGVAVAGAVRDWLFRHGFGPARPSTGALP